jgi:chromosome segregation ATPase
LTLSAQQELLGRLTRQIDDGQNSMDDLRSRIPEAEISITDKQHEISQLQTLRQKQSTESPFLVSCPVFDVEHRNFVTDFLDRIYELEHALKAQEKATRDLSDEYNSLVREKESLRRNIRRVKGRIERAAQDSGNVVDRISVPRRRLRLQKVHVKSNAQTLIVTEAAVSGLVERRRNIEENDGNVVELQSRVRSIAVEIEMEQCEIDRLTNEIAVMDEGMVSAIEEMDREMSQIRKIANCEEEAQRSPKN